MTAYTPTTAAQRPQLALVALLVLALHALLLGLPNWLRTAPAAGDTAVFQFRTIVPEPPQPAAPAQTKPPPKPKPKPKPKPRPEPRPTPDNPPVTPDSPPPPVEPAAPIATTSLLQAPPRAVFGGTMPPRPITPPLPPDQTAAVMRQAAQPASSAEPNAGAPGPIPPVQPPPSASLIYQTTVIQAERQVTLPSTIVWQRDEQYYKLSWSFYGPAIGDRGRQVTGLLTARGLAPVTALSMGAGGYHLTFDYAQSRLRGPAPQPASAPEAAGTPLQPGAQDPFGAWLQLAALIAGDPAQYPAGSRIVLPVTSEGEEPSLRSAEFIVADDRDLELTGELANQRSPGLHLVHEPADDQDTRIELWLAKRLNYLPSRLLISPPAGGDRIEMTLQKAELLRPPLSSAPVSPASGESGGDRAR